MPKKQCAGSGKLCFNLIELDKRYCTDCKQQDNKRRDQRTRDPESKKTYDSVAWKQLRKIVLSEEPFCQCTDALCKAVTEHPNQEDGPCGRIAGEVDHIIPMRLGGQPLARSNAQSLCHDCHVRKTRKEDGWNGGKEGKRVFVIYGPPGAGKSTFVENNAKKGALILDFDKLVSSITNIPTHRKPEHLLKFAWEARDAILNQLDKTEDPITAWIIDSGFKRSKIDEYIARYGAKVFVLETPELVCIQRVDADLNRDMSTDWQGLIRLWWSTYRPNDEDIKINE